MKPGDICVVTESCSVKEWHGKRVRLIAPSPRAKTVCWRASAIDALPHGQMSLSRKHVGPYLVGDVVNFPNANLRVLDPQPMMGTLLRTLRDDDTKFALRRMWRADEKPTSRRYVAGRESNLRLTADMHEATEFANVLGGSTIAVAKLAAELASIMLGCEIVPIGIERTISGPRS